MSSEPSEEAKQAGVRCNRHAAAIEHGDNDETTYAAIIQQAIDAATAKLRGENERLREALQIIKGAGYSLTLSDGTNVIEQALSPEAAQQQQKKGQH